jgi:dimethylargininase
LEDRAFMTGLFDYSHAIVRTPGASVIGGLRDGGGPDPDLAALMDEHAAYCMALSSLGVAVSILPPLEAFPDSVFVEDVALVFGKGAVRLRPGAPSRAGEVDHIGAALAPHFDRVLSLEGPGHADGGDILTLTDRVIIGLSARTDRAGAEALVGLLAALGLKGEITDTPKGVLHFKTGCSLLDEETVFVVPALAECAAFAGLRKILTPPGEEAAANLLRVRDRILMGAHFPQSLELVARYGIEPLPLPVTHIGRVDAGLSCMSLRWAAPRG